MTEMNLEELEDIKNKAFLEGVVGTLTRINFLIKQEKDPKVAVEKLREEIDRAGKEATNIWATGCNMRILKVLGH